MIVLVAYGLILHLISFVVLQVKYNVLKGKLEPLDAPVPMRKALPAGELAVVDETSVTSRTELPPSRYVAATKLPSFVEEVDV